MKETKPQKKIAAVRAHTALENSFKPVETDLDAERALDELEKLESQRRQKETAVDVEQAAAEIENAAEGHVGVGKSAEVISETARQIEGASIEEGEVFDEIIPSAAEEEWLPEPAQKGRSLLRKAMIKRLKPFEALDTWLYLEVNRLPHTKLTDRWVKRFSWLMTGGHGWLVVLAVAFLLDRPRALRAALRVLPALWLSTMIVEYPVKRYFRRHRPFITIVQAIVIGRKPGSFSFPSGHSAAAFAGAYLLSKEYPGARWIFRLVASSVAFSRVYLGAHYPGDVVTGGLMGMGFAKGFRGIFRRVFAFLGNRFFKKNAYYLAPSDTGVSESVARLKN